jgi:hypothetical protein
MIGGKREGAGRKRAVEGELLTTVAFGIAQRHVQAIKDWQMARGCRSASEAVRQMIDFTVKADEVGTASLEFLKTEPPVLPAGGENSPDWQWKRQPISRPTKESRPKRSKPNSKSKGV